MFTMILTQEDMAMLARFSDRAQATAHEARDAAETAMRKAREAEKAANALSDLVRSLQNRATRT